MRYENKALRDLARDEPCSFRLPGCDGGGETSVWVHSDFMRHGKGKGLKAHDCFGAVGCASCHAMLPQLPREMRDPIMTMAMEDTALRFWQAGKFSVTGSASARPTRKPQPREAPTYQRPSKVLERTGYSR